MPESSKLTMPYFADLLVLVSGSCGFLEPSLHRIVFGLPGFCLQDFRDKEGLGCARFCAVIPQKTRNVALPCLETPVFQCPVNFVWADDAWALHGLGSML